jgi:nitrogen regulatory protein PII-like uncharacterized protein
MADDSTQRMREIQEKLLVFLQPELSNDKDFMYMATMLLKHSVVLYQTFLDDESLKEMLHHVADNLADNQFSIVDLDDDDDDDSSATRH